MRDLVPKMNAMLEIRIDPEFQGPTLLELDSVLNNTKGGINARWEGTKPEIRIASRLKRQIVLYVRNIGEMEQAASALGVKLEFASSLLTDCTDALLNKNTNWRAMSEGMGHSTTRAILTKLAADYFRKGKRPKVTALVANECLFGILSPLDAEVVIRLRGFKHESRR